MRFTKVRSHGLKPVDRVGPSSSLNGIQLVAEVLDAVVVQGELEVNDDDLVAHDGACPLEFVMMRTHAGITWYTRRVESNPEGWVALELWRQGSASAPFARVVYWDAMGQFVIETTLGEVPLGIVEELMAEAKAGITVR